MKNILLLIFLSVYNIGLSQDPRLFTNDWLLTSFVNNGEVQPIPNNNEFLGAKLFFDDEFSFTAAVCSSRTFIPNYSFDNMTYSIIAWGAPPSDGGNCSLAENDTFEQLYFDFFYGTLYNYYISEIGSGRTLTLSSINNQTLIFSSQNLINIQFSKSKYVIFPNPTNDYIEVNNGNEIIGNASFEIFNALGQSMKSGNIISSRINVTDLINGIYLIHIKVAEEIFIEKFVKN